MTQRMQTRWGTLVLACVAQFMVILDVSVVNVALPSIQSGLDFSHQNLQWVVNAYALTFAGFLLLGGRATDLLGRRRVFIGGLLLLSAASLVGGMAQTEGQLIAARAVQGLGRRDRLAGLAGDHHHHLHRAERAQPGAGRLGRDGRGRRRDRACCSAAC